MLILADSASVRQTVFATADDGSSWVDISAPDRPTLSRLSAELDVSEEAIEDCLDMHQLPKVEHLGAPTFMILRLDSGNTSSSASGVYDLTEPLALLVTAKGLVTLHRRDHPVLFRLRRQFAEMGAGLEDPVVQTVSEVLTAALMTFDAPLTKLSTELVELETNLFNRRLTEAALEQVFLRKRRASVIAWVLQRTREMLARANLPRHLAGALDTARETVDALQLRAREVVDFTDNLLNLQIAIASHRTNEVMRLLTLMSAVFMPLTFIVGVYGMNFPAPEFGWRFGYLGVWSLILAVFAAVLRWFRKRGLLG